MTPREKAVRLVDRYLDEVINEVDINDPLELPKRLALISVNQMIDMLMIMNKYMVFPKQVIYYQEVKQEIEKL